MKISRIEFENFRNFKDHGEIKCSTDGRVTIIYGNTGDGKTTLHQLLQWVFYGKVSFNDTATRHLYNHEFERNVSFGDSFEVMGRVDFTHDSNDFSITRVNTYRKDLNDSTFLFEDISLLKKNDNSDWIQIEEPKEVIEKLLPSGLAKYFFFDGERMIADLQVKGRDSAKQLKQALYSILDLDAIEAAINHIGGKDSKSTALGKIYMRKPSGNNDNNLGKINSELIQAETFRDKFKEALEELEKKKKEIKDRITSISEAIGNSKDTKYYEKERKRLKDTETQFLENADQAKRDFGAVVIEFAPRLFASKIAEDAKNKLKKESEKHKLPDGLNRSLVEYLSSGKYDNKCICGNTLCESDKEHLKEFLDYFYPNSYTQHFQDFQKRADLIQSNSSIVIKEQMETKMVSVLRNQKSAADQVSAIRNLDEEQKNNPNIDHLVIERGKLEIELEKVEEKIKTISYKYNQAKRAVEKLVKDYDAALKKNTDNKVILRKIEILEAVRQKFEDELNLARDKYSVILREHIQELLDTMMEAKRTVTMSNDFTMRITDAYDDESKSEGQFAVASFAYIGGILKMLQNEQQLSVKEYPLVLDGPFSKLDNIKRQKVIDNIPLFAPQVILFSKDDLQDAFAEDKIGKVYTIRSNETKNVAVIKEGFLWK